MMTRLLAPIALKRGQREDHDRQGQEGLDEPAEHVVDDSAEVTHEQGPTAVPSTVPSSVASGAMIRMSREPTITRENMSRPSWSVPNQCALDGALLIPSRFWAYGLCGAIAEPKIAQMIQISEDDRTDDERRRVQELAEDLATELGPAGGERACVLDRDVDDAHSSARSRIRGLSSEKSMSATSVTIMYTTPIVSTPASSIGMSCWVAALYVSSPMPL